MATKTWSTGTSKDSDDPSAWNGGTLPTGTDTLIFSNAGVGNCSWKGIPGWSGGPVTVQSTYSGQITQTAAIVAGAFSIAGGTWDVNGQSFTSTTCAVTGGIWTHNGGTISTTAVTFNGSSTINATSGNWNLAGSWTQSGSSSTFNANGGTITIIAASTFTDVRSAFNKINWATTAAAITIAAGTTCPLGANPTTTVTTSTVTINGIVTWSGTWTHTGTITTGASSTLTGTGTPIILCTQSITINATATITNAIGTITFNGTSASTITDTADKLASTTYSVNKTSTGTFTIAASTIARFGANPTIVMGSGAIAINGTLIWSGLFTSTTTGGITTANGSTLTGTVSPALSVSGSLTITPTTTITNPIVAVTATGGGTAVFTDVADVLSTSTWTLNRTSSFTVAPSTTVRLGLDPVISLGSTGLIVNGTVTATGTVTINRVVTVNSGGVMSGFTTLALTAGSTGLTCTAGTMPNNLILNLTGTTSKVIDASAVTFSSSGTFCSINQGGGNLTIQLGTTIYLGPNPTITHGSFTLNGTLHVSGVWTDFATFILGATGVVTGGLTDFHFSTGNPDLSAGGTWPEGVNIQFTPLTSPRSFHGGGRRFGDFERVSAITAPGNGTAPLTINGSNTWDRFIDTAPVVAHSIVFTAGTTQTADDFIINGALGLDVTLQSNTPGSKFTLHSTGEQISCDHIIPIDCIVDVSPEWFAGDGSTDGGGNLHWIFRAPVDSNFRRSVWSLSITLALTNNSVRDIVFVHDDDDIRVIGEVDVDLIASIPPIQDLFASFGFVPPAVELDASIRSFNFRFNMVSSFLDNSICVTGTGDNLSGLTNDCQVDSNDASISELYNLIF